MYKIIYLILSIFLICNQNILAQKNILVNGDFENSRTGWYNWNPPGIAPKGSKFEIIDTESDSTLSRFSKNKHIAHLTFESNFQQIVKVIPGADYILTFKIARNQKSIGARTFKIALDTKVIYTETIDSLTFKSAFIERKVRFLSEDSVYQLGFFSEGIEGGGPRFGSFIDDISLYTNYVPPTDVKIIGRVVDLKTNQALPLATIAFEWIDQNGITKGSSFCNEKGEYSIDYSPNVKSFKIRAVYNGYFGNEVEIKYDSIKGNDNFNLDIPISKLTVGTSIKLDYLLFDEGRHDLSTTSQRQLELVVNLLHQNPTLVIKLEGHTDNSGSTNMSMELSERRVMSARDYLISNGIKGKRIKYQGYGGTKPIVNNSSEENRTMNRRVEMLIIEI